MKSTKYSMWYSGQPNGGTKENCVHFHYNANTNAYGHADLSCTTTLGFVCEIEIK